MIPYPVKTWKSGIFSGRESSAIFSMNTTSPISLKKSDRISVDRAKNKS